jgi:hypothetical protein
VNCSEVFLAVRIFQKCDRAHLNQVNYRCVGVKNGTRLDPVQTYKKGATPCVAPFQSRRINQPKSNMVHLIDLVLDIATGSPDDHDIPFFLAYQGTGNG